MNFSRVIYLVVLLGFSVLIGLTSSVNYVLATSGACSGHDGVDCSAGADLDGSVICDDGWRGSSVSYVSWASCYEGDSISTYTVHQEPVDSGWSFEEIFGIGMIVLLVATAAIYSPKSSKR
ncbi:MAG: hypothetical protein WC897_04920 [Candidatus Gracilibacteria bacterium]